MNLDYCLISAQMNGEIRHAREVMRSLGITYQLAIPQSLYDSWWFWNCENVPEPLPKFLSPLKVRPHEAIGHGLTKEQAAALARKDGP